MQWDPGRFPRRTSPCFWRARSPARDASLSNRLAEIWGTVRSSDAARRATVERYRKEMSSERLATADLSQGVRCSPNSVPPAIDCTESARKSDRSHWIRTLPTGLPAGESRRPERGRSSRLQDGLHLPGDGRVLNGILRKQTDRIVTLQTQGEMAPLERADISTVEPSDQSMMPEGMLDTLPRPGPEFVGLPDGNETGSSSRISMNASPVPRKNPGALSLRETPWPPRRMPGCAQWNLRGPRRQLATVPRSGRLRSR